MASSRKRTEQRRSHPSMDTSQASPESDYGQIWPGVAPRLAAALRQRGVPASQCDDLVQETAARLWERWSSVDTRTDVFPLALIIARNLATDAARKDRPISMLAAIEDHPSSEDPAVIASARLELRHVLRMVMTLNPRYRDLLLAEAGMAPEPSETGGVVTNMARMRARHRLRTLVERAGAGVTLPLKKLRDRVSAWFAPSRLQASHSLSSSILEIAIACALSLVGSGVIAEAMDQPRTQSASLGAVTSASTHPSGKDRIHLASGAFISDDEGAARKVKGAPEPQAPSGLPLDMLPRSKGKATDEGTFGLAGYDFTGQGETDVAGEPLEYRYRNRYRSPRCVRRLENDEISTDCSGGRAPSGSVEVDYQGDTTEIDYGS